MTDLFRGSAEGRVVTYVLFGLLAGLILARIVVGAREDALARRPAERARRRREADPWLAAQRLAADGQFTEAAHALVATLLASCAARGEFKLHVSKTTGDYSRELRRRGSPLAGGFQQFRERYDTLIYGTGTCTAADYASLLGDVRPLLQPVFERGADLRFQTQPA